MRDFPEKYVINQLDAVDPTERQNLQLPDFV